MVRYVAFLRGINSGLNPFIKMDVLKDAFEGLGFENVTTVIASGNVIFDAEATRVNKLEQTIQRALPKAIGFESATVVYRLRDLQSLAKLEAFKDIETTSATRLFVTFVQKPPKRGLKLSGNGFNMIRQNGRALFSVLDLSGTTPDLMKLLDKEFGRTNTTRSWKTIEKILKKAEA